jgi:hypothetical protein
MKLSITDDPSRGPEVEIDERCSGTFVVVNGIEIARRASQNTWVSLLPGWTVTSSEDRVEITYDSTAAAVH